MGGGTGSWGHGEVRVVTVGNGTAENWVLEHEESTHAAAILMPGISECICSSTLEKEENFAVG
jgi:hypothetical protein